MARGFYSDAKSLPRPILSNIGERFNTAIACPSTICLGSPLCLQDAADLNSVGVNFCNKSLQDGGWILDWLSFYEIIRKVWTQLLPIESPELWAALKAHGVPDKWKRKLSDFFTRGRDLLLYTIGKRPFKNKRIELLSQ